MPHILRGRKTAPKDRRFPARGYGRGYHYRGRVCFRVHNQYNIRAWSMGLFASAVQSPRSGLPPVYRPVGVFMYSGNLPLRNAS